VLHHKGVHSHQISLKKNSEAVTKELIKNFIRMAEGARCVRFIFIYQLTAHFFSDTNRLSVPINSY